MQNQKWESVGLYENPAKHQAGTVGKIVQSPMGIYVLQVGGSRMSCPQDWAAKIHADETKKSEWITIRTTPAEKAQIEADAKSAGLDNISSYILQMYRQAKFK